MKELKKILFRDLPPVLDSILAEQLSHCAVTRDSGAGPFDLVVGGGEFPGCPVLEVPASIPLRLGPLLRAIGRMLAEPVLYLSDIPLGRWTFRPQERRLEGKGEGIDLTDREADMLAYLAKSGTASRDDLLKNVWRYQEGVDTHTLETHIHRLRRKTGQDLIVTCEGGYRLCGDKEAG